MIEAESAYEIVKSRIATDRGAALVDYTLIFSLLVLALLAGVSMIGSVAATSLG